MKKKKESTGHEVKRRIPAVRDEKEERTHRARSQTADTCGVRRKSGKSRKKANANMPSLREGQVQAGYFYWR
jgi:hypothetical protein